MKEERKSAKRSRREELLEAARKDLARRRRERSAIVIFGILVAGLLYLSMHMGRAVERSFLLKPFIVYFVNFAVWALLVVLILVLVFLIVRNFAKFYFERRRGILGARIRIRLVMAFMFLTLGPAAVLFFLSTFILNTSIERLYSPHVANMAETSKQVIEASTRISDAAREIVEGKYEADGEDALHFARELSRALVERGFVEALVEHGNQPEAPKAGEQGDRVSTSVKAGDSAAPGVMKTETKEANPKEENPASSPPWEKSPNPMKEQEVPEHAESGESASVESSDTIASPAAPSPLEQLKHFVEYKRREYNLALVAVYDRNGRKTAESKDPALSLPEAPREDINKALSAEEGFNPPQVVEGGAVIYSFYPVPRRAAEGAEIVGVVVAGKFISWIPEKEWSELTIADQAREMLKDYETLARLELPIKGSYFLLLVMVTLIVIFLAIWFGFYLAKGITEPIQLLAEGTAMISSGNLDYRIDIGAEGDDEISTLVKSFNRMTEELSRSRKELNAAYQSLARSNVELEQRRLYMETVLGQVAAAVVSVDPQDKVSTLNPAALALFKRERKEEVLGKPLDRLFSTEVMKVYRSLAEELEKSGNPMVQRQVSIPQEGRSLVLLISVSRLTDEKGESLGRVIVIDDMTELIKAHRAMAWREVARRIAHEIKNPLTPIQLAAQRLERRLADKAQGQDREVLQESVRTIIREVEGLKHMVNEFSLFARMPSTRPEPSDLHELVREVIALYREAHPRIKFELRPDQSLPEMELDREQMKRVFINLFDNAIASMPEGGELTVETMFNPRLKLARVEIKDTGEGIPPHLKERLFEPYYSTKPGGSGLGLTIVQRIIADHYGYIRVADNEPKGAKIIIELPVVLTERRVQDLDQAKTM